MEKRKVTVKINGMDYNLVSDEKPAYVQKVAVMVDEQMKMITKNYRHLSTAYAAILAAINMADICCKAGLDDDDYAEENESMRVKYNALKEKFDALELENENLKDEIHSLEIELVKREAEIENLRNNF